MAMRTRKEDEGTMLLFCFFFSLTAHADNYRGRRGNNAPLLFDLFSFRRQDCFIYFATIQLNSSLITSINGRCYADARSIKQVQFKWRISQIFFWGKDCSIFPAQRGKLPDRFCLHTFMKLHFLGKKQHVMAPKHTTTTETTCRCQNNNHTSETMSQIHQKQFQRYMTF